MALDDAKFLTVADVPRIQEEAAIRSPDAEAPVIGRWFDGITSQFTAWVQAEAE